MGKTAPILQMRKTKAQGREIFCPKCHDWAEAMKVQIPFPGGQLQGLSGKVVGQEARQANQREGPSSVLLAQAPPGAGAPTAAPT